MQCPNLFQFVVALSDRVPGLLSTAVNTRCSSAMDIKVPRWSSSDRTIYQPPTGDPKEPGSLSPTAHTIRPGTSSVNSP